MTLPDSETTRRMPADAKSLAVLQQRAARLAADPSASNPAHARHAYVRVRLGNSGSFGISHRHADEVVLATDIAPVPCTPAHIAGVISLRGEMLVVIDLLAFFGMGKTLASETSSVLIVRGKSLRIGVLLDDIEHEAAFAEHELVAPLETRIDRKYVIGLHDEIVTVLDFDAILESSQLIVDA